MTSLQRGSYYVIQAEFDCAVFAPPILTENATSTQKIIFDQTLSLIKMRLRIITNCVPFVFVATNWPKLLLHGWMIILIGWTQMYILLAADSTKTIHFVLQLKKTLPFVMTVTPITRKADPTQVNLTVICRSSSKTTRMRSVQKGKSLIDEAYLNFRSNMTSLYCMKFINLISQHLRYCWLDIFWGGSAVSELKLRVDTLMSFIIWQNICMLDVQ